MENQITKEFNVVNIKSIVSGYVYTFSNNYELFVNLSTNDFTIYDDEGDELSTSYSEEDMMDDLKYFLQKVAK